MGKHRHERYLIALAMLITAGILLYHVFGTERLNAAARKETATPAEQAGSVLFQEPPLSSHAADGEQEAQTMLKNEHTGASAAAGADVPQTVKLVNINTATKEQLMSLKGIGEVKAEAILEYRRENGNFQHVKELTKVAGIGDKTLEKLRNAITV